MKCFFSIPPAREAAWYTTAGARNSFFFHVVTSVIIIDIDYHYQ
ncbi:hypothetical protein [Desulfotruncus arcticus]|nr:hypothetical protein [Desulfotruncus arcticus]